MGKNFLERQWELRQAAYEAGFEEGVQYAQDCMVEAMRGRGYGENRMIGLLEDFEKIYNNHFCCFDPEHPEADYHRVLLDREQKAAFGEKAEPFEKRFPYALKIRYDKPIREKHRKKR